MPEPRLMEDEQLALVGASVLLMQATGHEGPQEAIMARMLEHIAAQDLIIKRLRGDLS